MSIVMNQVAIKVSELILWEAKNTPYTIVFRLVGAYQVKQNQIIICMFMCSLINIYIYICIPLYPLNLHAHSYF